MTTSDGGGLTVGKLDGEPQPEARAGEPQLLFAHLVEEPRAVAQRTGTLETGYQTTLPKPRRPVKAGLIWSQSERRAVSWGAPMERRRWELGAIRPE